MLTESNISPSPLGGLRRACRVASFGAFSQMGSFSSSPLCVQAVLRHSSLLLLHPLLPAPAAVSCCLSNSLSLGSHWMLGISFSVASQQQVIKPKEKVLWGTVPSKLLDWRGSFNKAGK